MEYDKPHLSIPEQVARLRSRGLEIADEVEATKLLTNVGYYRLSAYAYSFRALLPAGAERETSVQYRASEFIPGTKLESVRDLWAFDRRLRLICLDALETVEIALRSRIGYHLGARNAFGYLVPDYLEPRAVSRRRASTCECDDSTYFEAWVANYRAHQISAEAEDFITHYVEKYEGKLPIWVATETMDFGALVRLYGFMRKDDQSAIARDLNALSGAWLTSWLKVANYVRNVSAHHSRLWNRTLTYKLRSVPNSLRQLDHLNGSPVYRKKVYGILAILASTTASMDPESTWRATLIDHLDTFPSGGQISPEGDMGFPTGWRSLDLWT